MRINKQSQILTSPKYLKDYANFEKAVRFADQQLKVTLLQYEEKVQYTLDEQKYNEAIANINKENSTEQDYKKAVALLNSIIDFKDSKDKIALCIKLNEELQERLKYERNEKTYKQALEYINKKNPTQEDYGSAIKLLETIVDFKDSKDKIEPCRKKIEDLKKDAILNEAISKEQNLDINKENSCVEIVELYKKISGWKDAGERLKKLEKYIEETKAIRKGEKRANSCVFIVLAMIMICIIVVFSLYNGFEAGGVIFSVILGLVATLFVWFVIDIFIIGSIYDRKRRKLLEELKKE